ncbi:hypothetical protein B9T13_10205 [Wohlfahrtiimonas chitiniclastica]|uniref:restriction endonuclease subunit S n=1 Tax=Wohlfahrtiimonas chitiniclastica TaxID=400946 RepID=UPI000B987ED3|nr:restriction endonuclease subunit S [Wohlfahrtiimonas chitiniclastica]OYQ69027.1 hypothetical protein B9T13_10205 [Wohlfahrtiimonas chitiniclastica]
MSYQSVKLGEAAKFIRGITYKPNELVDNFSENSIVCMRTANVQTILKQDNLLSVPKNLVKDSNKVLIEGDILVSTANSWNLVGKCCWVPKLDYTATAGGFISILRANKSLLDQKYLYYWFNSDNIQLAARNCGRQTTNISNMDLERCLNIQIPLPPLEEQRRIAEILDKADELIQNRKKAIEKLDELLQATFIDMFGDPVTNPKGWEKYKIDRMLSKDKYSLKRGPFGGALKKEIFVDSGYLVYEQYHALNNDFNFQRYFIDEDKYKELESFSVKPKDLIISCSGVNLGKLAEIPSDAPKGIINQALLKLSLDQTIILNDVFIDIFTHPNFKKAFYGDFRGAAIPNFPPMSTFKEFEFIVPPILIQKKYQNIKLRIKLLQQQHQNAIQANLFKSLQQQAFSGQL